MTAKRQGPEAALHRAVADFLAKSLRPPTWWSTFPAGGGGIVRGAKLKAMGLRAGVPDLLIFHPQFVMGMAAGCIVVGAELKAGKNGTSDEQDETMADLMVAGAHCGVCRSIEDVAALLRRHGVPVHGKVMAGGGYRVVAK